MKPTLHEIHQVVESFDALEFFPRDSAAAKAAVIKLIAAMVGTVEQLAWLQSAMLNRVGRWHGPKELRAVFCTRFRPADGLEVEYSTVAGFTPADSENIALQQASNLKRLEERTGELRRIEAVAVGAKMLPAPEEAPVEPDVEREALERRVKAAAERYRVRNWNERDKAAFAEWQRAHEQAEVVRG